jgi:hypothetical protein
MYETELYINFNSFAVFERWLYLGLFIDFIFKAQENSKLNISKVVDSLLKTNKRLSNYVCRNVYICILYVNVSYTCL